MQQDQDPESFETVQEVGVYFDAVMDAFRNSPDFAAASEGTFNCIVSLGNAFAAMTRIATFEIKKLQLRLHEKRQ